MSRENIVRTSDLIIGIEGNVILCSRGEIAIGYKIEYPTKYALRAEDYEHLRTLWSTAIRDLPIGTVVSKSDLYMPAKFSSAEFPATNYLQRAYKEYFEGRDYIEHSGYIFFVCANSNDFLSKNLGNPFRCATPEEAEQSLANIENFKQKISTLELLFNDNRSSKISLTPLRKAEIEEYTTLYFNGWQSHYYTDGEIKDNTVEIDNKYAHIISIMNEHSLPPSTEDSCEDGEFTNKERGVSLSEGFLEQFGLSFKHPHIYNQIIFIDDHEKRIEEITNLIPWLFGVRGFGSSWEDKANKLEGYLKEIEESGNKIVRGNTNIIYWGDSSAEVDAMDNILKAQLNVLNFKPRVVKRGELKELFYGSFFANASCLSSSSLYTASLNLCTSLFINTTNYRDDKKGVYLNDRLFNLPIKRDIFDIDKIRVKSRNVAIVASTGGGKSFTSMHIFRQQIDMGIIHVIIDIGESYLKLTHLYPTSDIAIINISPDTKIGFNPFTLERGEAISTDKIEGLTAMLFRIIKQDRLPSQKESTSLRKIIESYYSFVTEYNYNSFYNFIEINRSKLHTLCDIPEGQDYFDIEEFLHNGSPFLSDGIYGNVFREGEDSSNSQFVGKKIILFELSQIKNNPLLLSVITQIISITIDNIAYRDRSTKVIIHFEEFAEQLKTESIFNSVLYYTQTIRKYDSAVWIVLQDMNQLPDTQRGRSLIANIETAIIIQGANPETTVSRFEMSEYDRMQINSLNSKFKGTPPYSEIYIWTRDHIGSVFRIETPAELYYAFQTEGHIHEKMMHRYEQCGNMEQVIEEFVKTQ